MPRPTLVPPDRTATYTPDLQDEPEEDDGEDDVGDGTVLAEGGGGGHRAGVMAGGGEEGGGEGGERVGLSGERGQRGGRDGIDFSVGEGWKGIDGRRKSPGKMRGEKVDGQEVQDAENKSQCGRAVSELRTVTPVRNEAQTEHGGVFGLTTK